MHRISTGRFVTFGIITAFVSGFVTFVVFSTLYPLMLSADTVQSLAHNGKTAQQASAEFGFLPAFWVTILLLAYVGDHYLMRRRPRGA
jgi:hypothetical protein